MSSEAFRSATDQTLSHLTILWELRRVDGRVFRFTDHETPVEFGGSVFIPGYGIQGSALQKRAGLRDANMELTGALSHDSISDDDLRRGLFRDATITEHVVDYRVPWAVAFPTNRYTLTDVEWNGEVWTSNLTGITSKLRRPVGRNFTRNCRHVLGDDGCGVNLISFARVGSVQSISRRNLVFQTDVFQAEDYFRHGVLVWSTGQNVGVRSVVRTSATGGEFSLQIQPPFPVLVGDEFVATPGCDKTVTVCATVYGNVVNFGGFPHMPGPDRVNNQARVRSGNPNGPPSQLRAEPGVHGDGPEFL